MKLKSFFQENFWAILTAVSAVAALALVYLDFRRNEPDLSIENGWNIADVFLSSRGIGISWTFDLTNNSLTDTVITSVHLASSWDDGYITFPARVDNDIVRLLPITLRSRSTAKLSIGTQHPISEEFGNYLDEVLREMALIPASDGLTYVSSAPLKIDASEEQEILSKVWDKIWYDYLQSIADSKRKLVFQPFSSSICDPAFNGSFVACVSFQVTTSDGSVFTSSTTMAGYEAMIDCEDPNNSDKCTILPIVVDLSESGCVQVALNISDLDLRKDEELAATDQKTVECDTKE